MKYHNQKIKTIDGDFDSKKEYSDWLTLKLREKIGEIYGLERQKKFELIPAIKTSVETLKSVSYVADFVYFDRELDSWVAMDSKGFKTDVYQIKKKLFIKNYPEWIFREKGKIQKIYKVK